MDVERMYNKQLAAEGKLGTHTCRNLSCRKRVIKTKIRYFSTLGKHELNYIALREITLSYRFPKSVASKFVPRDLAF